jgi:Fe-S-cluster-containing hydrogenase component 2
MITIKVEASRCPQNHVCLATSICPTGAIIQKSGFSFPEINDEKCAECGVCTIVCEYGAILKE